MNKYNIALRPASCGNAVIEYSRKCAALSDTYLIGEKSFPHVTLYQFRAESCELSEIIEKIKASDLLKSIELEFNRFSFIAFDAITFWVSLLPDQYEALFHMHQQVAGVISRPAKDDYDPHMTLMNSKNKNIERFFGNSKNEFVPVRDLFRVSIGICDEVGQYIKIIYDFDNS